MLDFREAARGKWRGILMAAGIGRDALTGKHCACPICGGKDRFRFDDRDGSGSSYCNQCGSKTGLDLVMAARKLDFKAARVFVMAECGNHDVEAKSRTPRPLDQKRAAALWDEGMPLSGGDPASRYLESRGIRLDEPPKLIRFAPRAVYIHTDGKRTTHPALVAKFVGAEDVGRFTLQHVFLKPDGSGKADVPVPKRTLAGKGSIPIGGAVRLCASAETMGIAEGIETALSAHQVFDLPVWATLTSGLLSAWQPPPTAKSIIVFLDADRNYAGQLAAYTLAHKLALKDYQVEVRHPPDLGMDWNDVVRDGLEGVFAYGSDGVLSGGRIGGRMDRRGEIARV